MNRNDATEDRLTTWLHEEASGELPDWVLGATFDQTRRETQRSSAWGRSRIRLQDMGRRPGRRSTMFLATRAVAVVALIALGTGLAFTLRPVATTGPGADVLAESPSPSPAASAVGSAPVISMAAALVSGSYGPGSWTGETETSVGGVRQFRGSTYAGSWVFDDPRLSGTLTMTQSADKFDGTDAVEDADLGWGRVRLENANGAWDGTTVGTTSARTGLGLASYDLAGTGGYEGLSAVLYETETRLGTFEFAGIIFPGGLPPDR